MKKKIFVLLDKLDASSSRNMLVGEGVMRAEKGTIRANFETKKYYQSEPNFNGVHSRKNLSKIKDGTYVINLDEYKLTGTLWTALYVNGDKITYSDSFRVEHMPK